MCREAARWQSCPAAGAVLNRTGGAAALLPPLHRAGYLFRRGVLHIAVIADTHDRYPPGLPGRLAAADEIWHLGDVCEPGLLAAFERPDRPVHVVLGNNEDHAGWPVTLELEREGWRFFLVHIPPREAPPGVHAVLHGHTHVPRDETDERGVRWLNPGCISRPNRGAAASFAWLTVERARPLGWKLIPV